MGVYDQFCKDLVANRLYYTAQLKGGENWWRKAGWNTRAEQETRWKVLLEIEPRWRGKFILDVGCGQGDLLMYLRKNKYRVKRYHGVDIMLKSLELAQAKYVGHEFSFTIPDRDWFTTDVDYAVASGAFNLKSPQREELAFATIKRMWDTVTRGVAVNFLSNQTPDELNTVCDFLPPAETLAKLQELTGCARVVLRQDYLPNDFTIYLYRGWSPVRRRT